MTAWNPVLRTLMGLPYADALQAHVDGLGVSTVRTSPLMAPTNDAEQGCNEKSDTQDPDTCAHWAATWW